MYDAADIERVRELLLQGWSKSAIARHLRISRRVIYNWAASGYFAIPDPARPDEARVRAGGASKLHAYEAAIARRLSANPAMSSRQILRELRELGYTGEITQLRTYLASLRRRFVDEIHAHALQPNASDEQARRTG